MTHDPKTVDADEAIKIFITTQVVTNRVMRALPNQIARKLRLSKSQEMLIRNIVLDGIIAISNSADESVAEYTDLVGHFKPLDTLTEQQILECPDWWFLLMREAAEEQAVREIDVNFKAAIRGEI
jgi:hypothetical protein